MCTNYRASRTALEHVARQAGIDIGAHLHTWRTDIWPDYEAPVILPAGDGAEALLGVYGFWRTGTPLWGACIVQTTKSAPW